MLWQRLYGMVWLAFFANAIVPRFFGKYVAPVHAVLGITVLVLARVNAKRIAALQVPDRIKRISQGVVATSTMGAVFGIALAVMRRLPGMPEWGGSLADGLHITTALAILAQSASLATGYDMWEEKEIGPSTAPSAPNPAPEKAPTAQ